jgi:hypothetical protein
VGYNILQKMEWPAVYAASITADGLNQQLISVPAA